VINVKQLIKKTVKREKARFLTVNRDIARPHRDFLLYKVTVFFNTLALLSSEQIRQTQQKMVCSVYELQADTFLDILYILPYSIAVFYFA